MRLGRPRPISFNRLSPPPLSARGGIPLRRHFLPRGGPFARPLGGRCLRSSLRQLRYPIRRCSMRGGGVRSQEAARSFPIEGRADAVLDTSDTLSGRAVGGVRSDAMPSWSQGPARSVEPTRDRPGSTGRVEARVPVSIEAALFREHGVETHGFGCVSRRPAPRSAGSRIEARSSAPQSLPLPSRSPPQVRARCCPIESANDESNRALVTMRGALDPPHPLARNEGSDAGSRRRISPEPEAPLAMVHRRIEMAPATGMPPVVRYDQEQPVMVISHVPTSERH